MCFLKKNGLGLYPPGLKTLNAYFCNMRPLNIGTEKALEKIKQYCAYQERCHSEVRNKLYSFGLNNDEMELLISTLIQENFLNEERFALAYAGGKFRIKKWGKAKIKQALVLKKISTYCISKALKSLDDPTYEKNFEKLAATKWLSLKAEKNKYLKQQKLRRFLLGKGYESVLITDYINKQL